MHNFEILKDLNSPFYYKVTLSGFCHIFKLEHDGATPVSFDFFVWQELPRPYVKREKWSVLQGHFNKEEVLIAIKNSNTDLKQAILEAEFDIFEALELKKDRLRVY